MGDESPKVKAAVVQAASVLFDREASVEKAVHLIAEAAGKGAKLILFPEAFIPAYPRGLGFGTVVGDRKPEGRLTWERYWANSVEVPGPVTERLGEAAREAGAYLVLGVIERDSEYSRGTVYCTLLYFGPDGRLMGKHRKLMPTAAERLIWGSGDGSTLAAFRTEIGVIGGLICWENWMRKLPSCPCFGAQVRTSGDFGECGCGGGKLRGGAPILRGYGAGCSLTRDE